MVEGKDSAEQLGDGDRAPGNKWLCVSRDRRLFDALPCNRSKPGPRKSRNTRGDGQRLKQKRQRPGG